jgi:hypothetical protein
MTLSINLSNKDVEPIMKAVGYVKKDWLESPQLGNLKAPLPPLHHSLPAHPHTGFCSAIFLMN